MPIDGLMAATISPDGKTLVYAFTRGLGFGSEVWLADIGGGHRRQVLQDAGGVVSSLIWSPDGRQIAFMTLLDATTPFAEAKLSVMNADGTAQHFLAVVDGGHGQNPIWRKDGQELFFVARENFDDAAANHDPTALVSSIRSIDVRSGKEMVLVPADGARQIDLSLSDDGQLFFVSDRAGALDVWSVNTSGQFRQITAGSDAKRHPVVIPVQ
jgi:Tol biopolymer transport system component